MKNIKRNIKLFSKDNYIKNEKLNDYLQNKVMNETFMFDREYLSKYWPFPNDFIVSVGNKKLFENESDLPKEINLNETDIIVKVWVDDFIEKCNDKDYRGLEMLKLLYLFDFEKQEFKECLLKNKKRPCKSVR